MPWQGADAVSFAMMPPSKYSNAQRAAYRYFLTGIFSIHRAVIWIRSNFEKAVYEERLSYFHLLKIGHELPKKQLYLYSKSDTICSAESIEHFMKTQVYFFFNFTLLYVCL